MNKSLIFAAAALMAVGFSSTGAAALDDRDLSDFSCRSSGSQSVRCEPFWKVKERREAEFNAKVLPLLKQHNYPGQILVEDPSNMQAVKAGWGTRKDCYKLPADAVTGNAQVDKAKTIYCIVKGKGYDIKKPKIVAGY